MFDIDGIKALKDYQRSNFYRAKVISLDDLLKLNRIQILIYGLTDDFPDESQPWCEFQFRDGVITYPNVNDIIWLFFEGGDIFRPIYLGTTYTGLDASTDAGWTKFLNARPAVVTDAVAFKTNIKAANNLTDPNSHLIVNDAHQQFVNFMLPEDNIQKVYLTGRSDVTEEKIPNVDPPGGFINGKVRFCSPAWAGKFPKTFDKDPKPMYIWYKTDDVAPALGGWTFYTEKEVKAGLMRFPDNLAHINYKRYQNWQELIKGSYFFVGEDFPTPYTKKRTISWDRIYLPPYIYWHPEMMIGGTPQPHYMLSFPFSKMNLTNRKYWKQHTILSHDGKSAIELDDNDGYERLRIDFNYGRGGLEFSEAGMKGVELWTDGGIHFHAGNKEIGGGKQDSRFVFNGQWSVFAGNRIGFISKGQQTYFAREDTTISSKYGGITLNAGGGINLIGKGFVDAAKDSKKDNQTGEPVVAASAECGAPMWGNFIFLDAANGVVTDGNAVTWMEKFNAAMLAIKGLCEAIQKDMIMLSMVAPNTVAAGIIGAGSMVGWKNEPASIVRLAGAWDKIQMQIGKA